MVADDPVDMHFIDVTRHILYYVSVEISRAMSPRVYSARPFTSLCCLDSNPEFVMWHIRREKLPAYRSLSHKSSAIVRSITQMKMANHMMYVVGTARAPKTHIILARPPSHLLFQFICRMTSGALYTFSMIPAPGVPASWLKRASPNSQRTGRPLLKAIRRVAYFMIYEVVFENFPGAGWENSASSKVEKND